MASVDCVLGFALWPRFMKKLTFPKMLSDGAQARPVACAPSVGFVLVNVLLTKKPMAPLVSLPSVDDQLSVSLPEYLQLFSALPLYTAVGVVPGPS